MPLLGTSNLPDPAEYDLDRQLQTGTAPDELDGRPLRGLALVDCDDICPQCLGSGEIHWLRRPPDPQTEQTDPCPTCHGQGTI